jgi:dihydrolipoamide dehydrogenase
MTELDILIIGAGAAGEYAASYSAGNGTKVGLVEKHRVGGACVFTACIPTKALIHAARIYKKMKRADFHGLPVLEKNANYRQVKAFKDRIIAGIGKGRDERMSKRGVTILKGTARFVSPHEIMVNDERIKADKVIIATGSVPMVPPVPGLDEAGYITNIGALELDHVPARLAIIGGGPVGVEFTEIFSAFGSKVHIFEMADRIVAMEDADISEALAKLLSQQGVAISTGVKVSEVKRSRSATTVTTENKKGDRETAQFDEILVATGRQPAIEELNLEAAGVETHKKGIKVDSALQTNVPHIWAAGDVVGPPYFTYVGNEQGKTAALSIVSGERRELNYDVLPRATFCDPEIGSVGLTEAQALEQGYKVKIGRFNYADMTRPIVSGDTEGFIKIVAEEASGHILGGHIIGFEASSLIHEVAGVMASGMTVKNIGNTLHAYPTLSEGVRYACQAAV